MKCRHTKPAIKSLVCGQKADVESVKGHISECPRCKERYQPILSIISSAEAVPLAPVDETIWGEFCAKLRRRIKQEQPAPLGWFRSSLLWVGQSGLVRFRKAAAVSLVVITFAVSLLTFLPSFWSGHGKPHTIAEQIPIPISVLGGELPPEMADVISIFGADFFVTGVFSGWIEAGDFIGGHELEQHQIIEALDYLLS